MKKRLLYKFIKGELSEEKEEEVFHYLNKYPKAKREFSMMKARYVAASLGGNVDQRSGKFSYKEPVHKLYKYIAVAVVVVLSTVVLTDYLEIKDDVKTQEQVLLVAKKGERKTFYLSDSTKVVLNSNSSLTYLRNFSRLKREVILQGEAYFDVTHDENHPFIVKTNSLVSVKVLGTAFNVKAYPDDKGIETTLVRGKVKVIEDKGNKTVDLLPSQKATYNKHDDKIIIENVKPQRYISWKEGRLVYDDTPMEEVIKDLERALNIEVRVGSKEILDFKYKGVMDNLSLDQVIELLELSSPIKITKYENTIHMDFK